jgi:hypothetical protein
MHGLASSPLFSLGANCNFKFEIKKAKEMHQRLDDVKGVDEIKEEI